MAWSWSKQLEKNGLIVEGNFRLKYALYSYFNLLDLKDYSLNYCQISLNGLCALSAAADVSDGHSFTQMHWVNSSFDSAFHATL